MNTYFIQLKDGNIKIFGRIKARDIIHADCLADKIGLSLDIGDHTCKIKRVQNENT